MIQWQRLRCWQRVLQFSRRMPAMSSGARFAHSQYFEPCGTCQTCSSWTTWLDNVPRRYDLHCRYGIEQVGVSYLPVIPSTTGLWIYPTLPPSNSSIFRLYVGIPYLKVVRTILVVILVVVSGKPRGSPWDSTSWIC